MVANKPLPYLPTILRAEITKRNESGPHKWLTLDTPRDLRLAVSQTHPDIPLQQEDSLAARTHTDDRRVRLTGTTELIIAPWPTAHRWPRIPVWVSTFLPGGHAQITRGRIAGMDTGVHHISSIHANQF